MQKHLIFFILGIISTNVFSQNLSLTAKYSTQLYNDTDGKNLTYWSYHSFSIEGLLPIWNNMLELGATVGYTYSELPFDTTIPEFSRSDRANVPKNNFGAAIYFFPFATKYSPFIGVRGNILFDFIYNKSNDRTILYPGFYNYRTSNDYSYSIVSGLKITKGKINIILELEYQFRQLYLEYDEYSKGLKIYSHSQIMDIFSLNFGIGLQFVF